MPLYKYPLEKGGPKLVEVSWKGNYKDFVVRLGEEEVGKLTDRAAVKEGETFDLPNGDKLFIQLRTSFTTHELVILYNGKPLPGSGSDPAHQLKNCAYAIYVFGIIALMMGAVA